MFQKHIRGSVQEDDERFHRFGRRDSGFSSTDHADWGLDIPSPAKFSEAAHPSAEGQKTVPEEDAAFDEVRKTVEDVICSLQPSC